MRYKVLFIVLLKSVGVWFIISALGTLAPAVMDVLIFALQKHEVGALEWPWSNMGLVIWLAHYVLPGAIELVSGLYLLISGKRVADLVIARDRLICWECGYDLTGIKSTACPECGVPFRRIEPVAGSPATPSPTEK